MWKFEISESEYPKSKKTSFRDIGARYILSTFEDAGGGRCVPPPPTVAATGVPPATPFTLGMPLPVLANVERPLEFQMSVIVVVNKRRDSVVVPTGDHSGWSLLRVDCMSNVRNIVTQRKKQKVPEPEHTFLLIDRFICGVWRIAPLEKRGRYHQHTPKLSPPSLSSHDVPASPDPCSLSHPSS